MPDEEEVVFLPGLPLVNLPGENPEPDLWTFEVETPDASAQTMEDKSSLVTIDYVHPGILLCGCDHICPSISPRTKRFWVTVCTAGSSSLESLPLPAPKGSDLGSLSESIQSVTPVTFEASLGTSCLLDSGPPK